jgi:hypothetical protein
MCLVFLDWLWNEDQFSDLILLAAMQVAECEGIDKEVCNQLKDKIKH